MFRNVIVAPKVTEIYEVTSDVKRGSLVTKNLSTGKAVVASDVGVDVYIVDADNQPTGVYSDVEISAYSDTLDVVKAGQRAVLVKIGIGGQFATDQVNGTFTNGDYAVAGTAGNAGKFVKAVATKVSTFKYIGTYSDGDTTLQRFEVVNPITVS